MEQIAFFGESNERLARALLPLLESPDPEIRRLATSASLLTRDMRFAAVQKGVGQPGAGRACLVEVLARQQPEAAEVLKAFGRGPAAG